MSEVSSLVLNKTKSEQFRFSYGVNLGAVDNRMCILEKDSNDFTLYLTWKVWDKELTFIFDLPSYVSQRNIVKYSLPIVRMNKKNEIVFGFSIQELKPDSHRSNLKAGVDLGRVNPFTLAVVNDTGARVAHYYPQAQTLNIARKQERLTTELINLHKKIGAYDALGLDSSVLRSHVSGVRSKRTRLTTDLAWRISADLHTKLQKHKVSLLTLEDLSWVRGAKYGSRWSHGLHNQTIAHRALREGVKVTKVSPRDSSRLCHVCGTVFSVLDKRRVRCEACQLVFDRDFNAALRLARGNKSRFPGLQRVIGDDCTVSSEVMSSSGSTSAVLDAKFAT